MMNKLPIHDHLLRILDDNKYLKTEQNWPFIFLYLFLIKVTLKKDVISQISPFLLLFIFPFSYSEDSGGSRLISDSCQSHQCPQTSWSSKPERTQRNQSSKVNKLTRFILLWKKEQKKYPNKKKTKKISFRVLRFLNFLGNHTDDSTLLVYKNA